MMRFRVVCGLLATAASVVPTTWFRRVDFPTFGRPTSVMKPARSSCVVASVNA